MNLTFDTDPALWTIRNRYDTVNNVLAVFVTRGAGVTMLSVQLYKWLVTLSWKRKEMDL